MQTVPIEVSNALQPQSIYHQIDSQLIFLKFKAGCGNYRFNFHQLYFLLLLYACWFVHIHSHTLHIGFFF